MRIFYFSTLIAFFIGSTFAIGQTRTCGTMDLANEAISQHPEIQKLRNEIDLNAFDFAHATSTKNGRSIITIPVVVHVVYRTPTENISDAQIQSQIDVLNEDYGRTNADASLTPAEFQGQASDTEIRFCLAQRDPSGQPTNGITRTITTANSFPLGGSVKSETTGGKSAWPSISYLNIWVCNLVSPVIGFATLPGTAAPGQDGVVIIYKHFGRTGNVQGPYNKGRTATHEIGHWLNLLHTWGDDENSSDNCAGTDQVADTPNQAGPYFGCPDAGSASCSSNDMFMNYMDYTDDACMNLFTAGQKIRMLATLNGFRSSILESTGCQAPLVANDCDTLNNIIGGDGLVFYSANEYFPDETGYLTGTSSLNISAFAEQYESIGEHAVYALRFDFSTSLGAAPGAFARVLVWDDDGTAGSPGTILMQTTYSMASIADNVSNFTFTDIELNAPVNVTGRYFVGFETNLGNGDSIAVYSNQFDEVNTNTGWMKSSTGDWLPFDSPDAFDGALTLAIRPIQCSTVGIQETESASSRISLFPNPSLVGDFNLILPEGSNAERWAIISIEGKQVASGKLSGAGLNSIHVEAAPGMYFLQILSDSATLQMIPCAISGW